jgi:glycosyltransferase involved in cell wall biosynthesis
MKILLLSRYSRLGASSRIRAYQYLPFLEANGLDVKAAPLFGDEYLRAIYSRRFPTTDIIRSYTARIREMFHAGRFDLIWLEYEVLPWLPGWLSFYTLPHDVPFVVDYDDAVFHRYDQHKFFVVRKILGKSIDEIMRRADLVVVGNDYLGDRARQAGSQRVELLPSAVDITRYLVKDPTPEKPITIGWIGSPSTAQFLRLVGTVLKEMAISRGIRVVAVGANPDQVAGLPIETKPWSEETEVKEIQEFDIGIMPLKDEPFERGKCGYKLIQYMACGKPVVASPVGVNNIIVRDGINGFLPFSFSQWGEALNRLCDDSLLRKQFGVMGRRLIEAEYSLQVTAPKLEALLRSVTRAGGSM